MKLGTWTLFVLVFIANPVFSAHGESCGLIDNWNEQDAKSLYSDYETWGTNRFSEENGYSSLVMSALNSFANDYKWRLGIVLLSFPDMASAGAYYDKTKSDWDVMWGPYGDRTIYPDNSNDLISMIPGPDNLSGDKAKRLFLMGKHLGTFVFYFSTWSTKPFDSDGLDISQLRSEALSIFGQAKALINSKCSLSACETGKMALPSELEYFIYLHQDYEYPLDSVVLGTDPNQVRPLYLGDPGQGGVRFDVGFCEFTAPVDVYLAYADNNSLGIFYMDSNRKARYFGPGAKNQITPFLTNLNEHAVVTLNGDFGGLFQDGERLPKGGRDFYVGVVPSGEPIFDLKLLWETGIKIECAGDIPAPAGKEMWFYPPAAVPGCGVNPTDPSKLRPLAVGPIALDGNNIAMYVDTCPFSGQWQQSVDAHFAVYCPQEDVANVYFFTKSKIADQAAQGLSAMTQDQLDQLLWEKVPLSQVLNTFPLECWEKGYSTDSVQESESWLLRPSFSGGLPASATQQLTYYMFAVTPHGVRDKFYAWVTMLPVNVRHAIARQVQ